MHCAIKPVVSFSALLFCFIWGTSEVKCTLHLRVFIGEAGGLRGERENESDWSFGRLVLEVIPFSGPTLNTPALS